VSSGYSVVLDPLELRAFISGIAPGNRRLNGLPVALFLDFRPYALPFRAPVRTAHGSWGLREGVIVRLEGPDGRVGWGEAAPVPGFGTETAEQDQALLKSLGGRIEAERWEGLRLLPPCLQNALSVAVAELAGSSRPAQAAHLPVAALLPAGRPALAAVVPRAEAGFRTFKWKVGIAPAADELGLLDELCALLPAGARLRIDANGAWDRRTAERWLDRCAERPVEFVEQPAFAPAAEGAAGRQRSDDLLLGLAGDFPTPLALDESLAGDGDVERWLGAGWPGVFVVKPALHGDLSGTLASLARARAAVVFSSALETAIGARAALRVAFAWEDGRNATEPKSAGKPRALGFGVTPLFADARFDGPASLPFLTRDDAERLNPEDVWNALS
jgi:O-succinylbenzoate synthase